MITFTKDEYLKKTGVELDYVLVDLDDNANKTDRTITEVCEYVYMYVTKHSQYSIPDDDDLTTTQSANIKNAEIWQLAYTLENGNLTNASGYNEDSGISINRDYLDRIGLSPKAYDYLKTCGLLNRNIKSSASCEDYGVFWR